MGIKVSRGETGVPAFDLNYSRIRDIPQASFDRFFGNDTHERLSEFYREIQTQIVRLSFWSYARSNQGSLRAGSVCN